MKHRSWVMPVAIIAAFVVADYARDLLARTSGFRSLYDDFSFWVPGSLVSLLQIAWCVLIVAALHRGGGGSALEELGCRGSVLQALIFGLLATTPLWLTFALTMPLAEELDPPSVLYLSGLSPLAEETLYRGFAFGQLRRLAGWSFWPAALVPSIIFGWGHLDGGESTGQAIGIVAITGLGSLLFCWLYQRWSYNLWIPVSLHVLMNLSWNGFSVGDSAFAGWLPTALQVITMVAAVLLTLNRERVPGLRRA